MEKEAALSILKEDWRSAGVMDGDLLLIHSSIKRTLKRIRNAGYALTPIDIVESLLYAVGPSGTVLFPLFNFDFAKGIPFDLAKSPSKMGALSEAARLYPGAVRTGHPMYSFVAIGAKANDFSGVENESGYGEDSPFGMLHRMGGKIGVLDVIENDSMTFYHYVEEMKLVPYRFFKTFKGLYRGKTGAEEEREFKLFVRSLDPNNYVLITVDPMGEYLWEQGHYSGFRPCEGPGLRVISASVMFEQTANIIDQGRARGMLYDIKPEEEIES